MDEKKKKEKRKTLRKSRKKYLIKPVNLGRTGEPARILAEKYLQIHGNQDFSKFVRNLIIYSLSSKKEYQDFKKDFAIFERKKLLKKSKEIIDSLKINEKECEKFKVDIYGADFI